MLCRGRSSFSRISQSAGGRSSGTAYSLTRSVRLPRAVSFRELGSGGNGRVTDMTSFPVLPVVHRWMHLDPRRGDPLIWKPTSGESIVKWPDVIQSMISVSDDE